MNNNEWKDLDPYNLPSDLCKPGAWEIEERGRYLDDRWEDPDSNILLPLDEIGRFYDYRIRRPAGWEPSKCPSCGSEDNSINPSAKVCDNPWHDEPKAPTHEEKCENCRFWKLGSFPSECLRHAPIGIESGSGVTREWPTTHSYDWCGDYEPCSE